MKPYKMSFEWCSKCSAFTAHEGSMCRLCGTV